MATAALSVVAIGASDGRAVAASGSSADTSSALGVTASAGGWINYTNTLYQRLGLAQTSTRTVAGDRSATGSCEDSGSGVAKPGSAATFQEEIALNPATCQERVVSGNLSAAGLAKLNALSGGGTSAAATSGVQAGSTAVRGSTNGALSSAATTWGHAYTKTAWIDPLDITITSLAPNISYPEYGSGNTVSWITYSYDFAYDGWSSSGITNNFSYLYPADTYGWQVDAVDHFTNTDFASFVYAVFGVAGWLACGAPLTATAHFNHNVIVQGYSNGNRGYGWNDTATGACTDLVHHASWSGFGSKS